MAVLDVLLGRSLDLALRMDNLEINSEESLPKPHTEPRKRVLAPSTPSPRKFKRRLRMAQLITCIGKRRHIEEPVDNSKSAANNLRRPELPLSLQPSASNVIQALKSKSKDGSSQREDGIPAQLIDFSAAGSSTMRDSESLTIIEQLTMGPYEHVPPDLDPTFSAVDPHSSIRLM